MSQCNYVRIPSYIVCVCSLPAKEDYVKVAKPDWGATTNHDMWGQEIKATWLGHACFLVELLAPQDSKISQDIKTPTRGPRILFDPMFSNHCSPSQWIGPARHTPPPMPLEELPQVDIVILSHNHYDHMCVFAPLYFRMTLLIYLSKVT